MLYPAELRAPPGLGISRPWWSRQLRWLALFLAVLGGVAPAHGWPQGAAAAEILLEAGGAAAIRALRPSVELRLEGGGTAVLGDILVPETVEAEARALLAPLLAPASLDLAEPAVADRHGRLRARPVGPDGRSLQAALVAAGLALVRPLPGSDPIVLEALLLDEARAEAAGLGLWRRPADIMIGAAKAETRLGRFVLLQGVVLQASRQQRYFYLNFGTDWRTDTTARIDKETLRAMQRAGFDPAALEGRNVRLRGTLFAENGPMLELWTHQGIEVLP